ncbi:MAG: bile acid:sodium symporter [Candidatus Micrarchaeota archaeon]
MDVGRYFWLFMLLGIALGLFLPGPGTLIKPFVLPLLAALMLISSLSINVGELKRCAKDWRTTLFVLFVQFVLVGATAYLFSGFFPSDVFLGLVIIAVTPSAISVTFLSELFGGSAALALPLTTLSNLLSVAVTPLLVAVFAGASVSVNSWSIAQTIALAVVLPFLIAKLVVVRLPAIEKPLLKHGHGINTIIITLAIWGGIAPSSAFLFANSGMVLWLAIPALMFCAVPFAIGWLYGKDREESITLGVTSSLKNVALGVTLASTFGIAVVAGPVVYTVLSNALLAILQLVLRKGNK